MDKIIKHLPLRCLPTLRSTCKLWNKLMVKEYRERKSTVDPYEVEINQATLDYVFNTLNEASEISFSAYKFSDIQMNDCKVQKIVDKVGGVLSCVGLDLSKLALSIETFRTLLFKQCPVLGSLGITDTSDLGVPRFWSSKLHEEEEDIMTLPHLKCISLGIWSKTKNQVYPTSDFSLISDLCSAAINLHTVEICEFGVNLNGVILDILLKQQQQQSGNLHKIRNIKLGEKGITIKNLEALVELSSRKSGAAANNNRLRLKKLDLRRFLSDACFMDPQGVKLMNQFLRLQASSLEKLTASLTSFFDYGHVKYKLSLPVMTSLKTLKLQMEYSSPPPPPAVNANANNNVDINAAAAAIPNAPNQPNIKFDSLITNFPNLQKLILMRMDWMMHGSNDNNDNEDEQEVINYRARKTSFMTQLGSHHGITELNIALDAEDSSYLVNYGSLFPNVKTLTVFFYMELYRDVWRVWPDLEYLTFRHLYHPEHIEIDSCITGIPSTSLKLLKSSSPSNSKQAKANGKANGHQGERKELDWKEYKTELGISDLHHLHSFNLYCVEGCVPVNTYVTDLSAKYGFIPTANNSKLRKIYIERCSNFSPEVVAAVEVSLGPHGDFVPIDEVVKRERKKLGDIIANVVFESLFSYMI